MADDRKQTPQPDEDRADRFIREQRERAAAMPNPLARLKKNALGTPYPEPKGAA